VNPVLQAQAVSRVHRIGQTKEVTIYNTIYNLFAFLVLKALGDKMLKNSVFFFAWKTYVHYYLIQDTVEIPCFDLFERNQSAALMTDHDIQDTAATAAEITNAQDRNGELVKLDDLKFCFQMQKQMNSERERSSC
jgi:hypothetical protein